MTIRGNHQIVTQSASPVVEIVVLASPSPEHV